MESVPCNLCGSSQGVVVRNINELRYGRGVKFCLIRCRRCNLVYLNPRPGEQEIHAYYPPGYQAAIRDITQQVRGSWIGRVGIKLVIRRNRTPPLAKTGRLLDIGCASGYYMAAMRDMGWETYGVEVDAEAAEYAREHYGLDVRTGMAESTLENFLDSYFDVVTMWHVLEHLFDPSLVLTEVYRVLKPGGMLMLEMPNFDSLPASVFGAYWFPLEIPRHLYHFTPQTLETMLAKTGFRLIKLTGVAAPIEIVWSLHTLWCQLTGASQDGRLVWSPALMLLLYPIDWVLSRFKLSTFFGAVAIR